MTYYKQCKLVKPIKEGNKELVTWLPEQFAVMNRILEIKDNGVWENGWCVCGIGTDRLEESVVSENSRDYRIQRKASDIFRGSSKK